MSGPLSIALPLVLAGVLIASGIAKLRHPDDLASWTDLGVPRALRREWLRRFHPWGELALAAALALLGGVLGVLAAVVAIALMGAYLVLVWRAYRTEPDASCACFGSRAPITRLTIARNIWLTILAIGVAVVIGLNPVVGGAVAAVTPAEIPWVIAILVAVVTVVLVVRSEAPVVEASDPVTDGVATGQFAATGDEGELDYIRTLIPAVPVTLADGTVVNLRKLAAQRPLLLLAVSPACDVCTPVIERVAEWRAMLPEVDIRLLLTHEPGKGHLTELTEPQSLHDPERYVRDSIGRWRTPTAVLLGVDGLLAGGPVTGYQAISDFIADVDDSLSELRAASQV